MLSTITDFDIVVSPSTQAMADPNPSPPTSGEDPWLTVAEVSDELKLHPATVRSWVKSGRLAAVRVGRTWRVRRSDLDRAIELDASPGYVAESGSSSIDAAAPPVAPTPAPRQIADHILTVTPAANGAS
jgi:excisionase family DNA binding protein